MGLSMERVEAGESKENEQEHTASLLMSVTDIVKNKSMVNYKSLGRG